MRGLCRGAGQNAPAIYCADIHTFVDKLITTPPCPATTPQPRIPPRAVTPEASDASWQDDAAPGASSAEERLVAEMGPFENFIIGILTNFKASLHLCAIVQLFLCTWRANREGGL